MDEETKTAWHYVALHDLHPGDEHPDRRGWILQFERGPKGQPMWFKPRPRWFVWFRRIVVGGVAAFFGVAMLMVQFGHLLGL